MDVDKKIVCVAVLLYMGVMSYLTLLRYYSYTAGMFDFGIMEQVLWNTSHGRLLTESVNMAFPLSRFWNGRLELIYIPVAFFHRIFPYPETGLIIQTVVLGLGALPIYWLTRDRLGTGLLSATIPIVYLLYSPLHNANLFDIHGITFATTILLFAFYYLQRGSWILFYIFSALLLFCREDASFLVIMFGFYALFFLKERNKGVVLACIGLSWFFMTQNTGHIRTFLNLPAIEDPNTDPGIWGSFGGPSPVSFVLTVLSNPSLLFARFWDIDNLKLVIKLFGPLGFIPFCSPSTLTIMLPNLSLNMISNVSALRDINHHYTSTITPVMFISLIMGLANVKAFISNSPRLSTLKIILNDRLISIVLICTSMISFFLWSNTLNGKNWSINSHHKIVDEIVDEIPGNASISTHSFIAPHVAHRESLFLLPDRVGDVQYIIYDFSFPFTRFIAHERHSNRIASPLNDKITSLLHDNRYGVVTSRDGLVVFRKGADFSRGIKILSKDEERNFDSPLSSETIRYLSLTGVTNKGTSGYHGDYQHFVFDWIYKKEIENDETTIFLVIVGGEGEERIMEHRPLFGLLNQTEWEIGEHIRDEVFIPISGLSPGTYTLFILADDDMQENSNRIPVTTFFVKEIVDS